jgi:hypothetical protein
MRLLLLGVLLLTAVHEDDYVKPGPITGRGLAPGLVAHLLSDVQGRKTYVLVFRTGDEVMSGLTEFAEKEHITGAHLTGLGGFQKANLGWYDLSRQEFKKNPVKEQVEVATLVGNIATEPGKAPMVHVHCALARRDGSMIGGHLLDGMVSPTLELFLTVEPTAVAKAHDPGLGIELIQ